jgi:chemosensory pili system protein ChpA (sensor histidine kinase/response regulator)
MTQPFDATPLAAFRDEFQSSVPRIIAALDAVDRDRSSRAPAHEAYRLIHALKGAASMVGLAALGHLLHGAEESIEGSALGSTPLTDETLAILRESMPLFAGYLDAALAGQPIGPIARELARVLRQDGAEAMAALQTLLDVEAREMAWQPAERETPLEDAEEPPAASLLAAMIDTRDAAPPRAPLAPVVAPPSELALEDDAPPEIPPELAEVFGQEAQEHLETIARVTSMLSTQSEDRDALQELRRAVHTLKGAAGVVGFKSASKLAHRMEDLLDRLFDGAASLTPESIRTLASSSDALSDLIVSTPDAAAQRGILARLFAEFDGLDGAAPASTPQAAPAAAADPPAGADRRRRGDDRRSGVDRRGGGQVLRVPLPRLNELVRVVSELVINRSTFEQHHLALIDQVEELKLSAARLRRVAHRLEADYEVRALASRAPRSAPGVDWGPGTTAADGFDELEFDRYTEFHLLTRELTETTSDIATIGARVAGTIRDFDGDLTRLGRLTRDVQDKTMELRMVPLATLAARIERAVRTTAETCGRDVELRLEGERVALDKSLLEHMSDPLLHLLRNAVDHGIEPPDERQAAGKRPRGTIVVRAFHEGTDVSIEVEDDGRGLDLERIRRTAVARGFITETAVMSTDALFALIFEPGFSTAERVSEVSGRGVGMDVVKATVARLGGRVQVTSRPGAGTTISVRVPMTLAMTRILLVRCGGQTFGLPLSAVMQIARPHPSSVGLVGGERVFSVDGRTYPLRDLADTLGLPRAADAPAAPPVLIANLSRRPIALAVDEIVNSRDAVVKTLGTHLRRVHGIWGATLLGDGTVVLILNPADLAAAADEPLVVSKPAGRAAAADHEPYVVLVVDDSLSMRHMLSLAVTKAGWVPVPARDGLEALEIIHRSPRPPDLVLLDIEMPRMDGYEFLSTVRSQKDHADLPIVMLTSRSSDKHRDKARALGVTDYMVKPFQEDALVRNIDRLVAAARRRDRRAAS